MKANVTGKKDVPAEVAAVTLEVAAVTLKALERRRPMALPSQTKLLPMMLRIAPNTIKRMVAKT